jgi:tRNA A-37 threonylcarbamoyl transferase component Bud32
MPQRTVSNDTAIDSPPTNSHLSFLLSRLIPQQSQGEALFQSQMARMAVSTDRIFAVVLILEGVVGIVLALVVSPLAWEGTQFAVHQHVLAAILLGGLHVTPALVMVWHHPGRTTTRHVVAIAVMLNAALYIHLTGGRIETHFMVFGTLAFLACYRDWKVLVTASVVVLVDHLLRGLFFPQSVYGEAAATMGTAAAIWRSLEHAWWVVFEVVFLIYATHRSNRVQQKVASEKIGEMGQYILKDKLGGGGMGEVYLAEHRLLKRPCALKLIRPDKAQDETTLARFEREVQTTAQLRHPNTISIFDYGRLDDGTFFYVMEYLPGLSLQQLVEQHGPMPPARVAYLLRQVCGALSEAHGIGLVHRDIKPDNILVCNLGGRHDVAKLFDFGLVISVATGSTNDMKLTQDGSYLGTPHYMSPEQVTGAPTDHRSDLFSLGAVAFFALTGKPPYEGDNPLSLLYARVSESVNISPLNRPDGGAELAEVVRRCMTRKPADRFADAKEVAKALAVSAACWTEDMAAAWWQGKSVAAPASTAAPSVPQDWLMSVGR